jgi:hypothetical protein
VTKQVPLSKGQVALVDDNDYERVMAAGPWVADRTKSAWTVRRWRVRLHLPLANFILDAPIGCIVDHADRNPFNNQRSNLRIATRSENNHNRRKYKAATSAFFGVSRTRWSGRWRARINKDGIAYHLGTYDDPMQAARAYDKKARELYGIMARLNFPD